MTWLLIAPMLVAGAYAYRKFTKMVDILMDEDGDRPGPRLRGHHTRPAMRAVGICQLTLAATMGALAITQGASPLGNSFALWIVGLVFTIWPGWFSGDLPRALLSKHDHKEPIGPELDSRPAYGPPRDDRAPWERGGPALEEWLDE